MFKTKPETTLEIANKRRAAGPSMAPSIEVAYQQALERSNKAVAALKAARAELEQLTERFTSHRLEVEEIPAFSRRRQELTALTGDLKSYTAELVREKEQLYSRLESARRQDYLNQRPLRTAKEE